jgi:hypothetical protein
MNPSSTQRISALAMIGFDTLAIEYSVCGVAGTRA